MEFGYTGTHSLGAKKGKLAFVCLLRDRHCFMLHKYELTNINSTNFTTSLLVVMGGANAY